MHARKETEDPSSVSSPAPHETLRGTVSRFFKLNPTLTEPERVGAYRLAERVAPAHFEEFAELTEQLIDTYLDSPPKHQERRILKEYLDCIDQSSRLLAARGELNRELGTVDRESHSMALVSPKLFSALDWCKVLTAARIPKPMVLAVDACRRRNQLVETVIEHMFVILQGIDFEQAMRWQLEYLERHRGKLDPDLARDLLNAWLQAEAVPAEALEWAQIWSVDTNLCRQWPAVVQKADRLLREHALRSWDRTHAARTGSLAHLHLLIQNHLHDEDRLLRWFEAVILDMSEDVRFFVSLNQDAERGPAATAAEPEPWRPAALVREIKSIEAVFTPILILSDLFLMLPDGAYRFALVFFGLIGRGREEWDEKLRRRAERAVRRSFVRALKEGRSPVEIISRLTFGDRILHNKLAGELDWITKHFDSINQREKVVKELAVIYASYREQGLLAAEIARRYRNLMRLLHEDNLRRLLSPEQYAEIEKLNILRDLAAIAGDARRFLSRRRALETPLEDMIATALDFGQALRRRRLNAVRRTL